MDSGISPQLLMKILEDYCSQILLLVSFSLGLNKVPVIIYALERVLSPRSKSIIIGAIAWQYAWRTCL